MLLVATELRISDLFTLPPGWYARWLIQCIHCLSFEQFTTVVRFFIITKTIDSWWVMQQRIEN